MKNDPMYQICRAFRKKLGDMQHAGEYWGSRGALSIGGSILGYLLSFRKELELEDKDGRSLAMTLASLCYGAASNAMENGGKAVLLLKPLWYARSWKCLRAARAFVDEALAFGESGMSPSDFDVAQSVIRKHAKALSFLPWKAGYARGEFASALGLCVSGLSIRECERIQRLLLLCGKADIKCLLGEPRAAWHVFYIAWEAAESIRVQGIRAKDAGRMSRVYRHLAGLATRVDPLLVDDRGQIPSMAASAAQYAKELARKSGSNDQQLKVEGIGAGL